MRLSSRMSSGPQPVGPRALVIEDAQDSRDLWALEFEAAGFRVFCAGDGETGIQQVQRIEPVLIVLDLMLPRMNGFSVARWVREHDGGTQIAILAVSALTSNVLVRKAIDAGCDAFLAKPVTAAAVVVEAARLLAEKTSRKRGSL
jgi:two-component system, cell cycle response regulator DivK